MPQPGPPVTTHTGDLAAVRMASLCPSDSCIACPAHSTLQLRAVVHKSTHSTPYCQVLTLTTHKYSHSTPTLFTSTHVQLTHCPCKLSLTPSRALHKKGDKRCAWSRAKLDVTQPKSSVHDRLPASKVCDKAVHRQATQNCKPYTQRSCMVRCIPYAVLVFSDIHLSTRCKPLSP